MAQIVVSDIRADFKPDPLTKDLTDIYQEDAVNQSIDVFISNPYRVRKGLTNTIFALVFSDMSYADASVVESIISDQLENNYRMIDIISLKVESLLEKRKYYVRLVWKLKNTSITGTYERYWEQ